MAAIPPASFLAIVQIHHLQAMLNLGILPNPLTGKPNPRNEPMARRELHLMEILREKTLGNLTEEEDDILLESINATRMALGDE